ncbi:3-deoxy-7-phosphoheptulonate synthase [Glycomyces fuscus]|nr:3-deoxy-7-phosphoheptulonate synthase [Glycomyces fuscus]
MSTGPVVRTFPAGADPGLLARVRRSLALAPALVTEEEVHDLGERYARAARGDAVVLQAGECAERFSEATPPRTAERLAQLRGLSALLGRRGGAEVVTVGRIAGQYAKPRSSPWEETEDGRVLPSYRGDAVNDAAPDRRARTVDPLRMLRALRHSREVLDTVRGAGEPRVFTSHEALLLDYEEPLVRGRHSSSAHTLWIGDRTRDPDGPHVAFARRLANPVGVKLGPRATPDDAVRLSRALNPEGVPGHLAFIVRLGAAQVHRRLPDLVSETLRRGAPVLWMCDPLHANTRRWADGRKLRLVETVLSEIEGFVRVLRSHRVPPAGLHLEITPDEVLECAELSDLRVRGPRSYRSACDPRLNPRQALRAVDRFGELLRG